MSDACNANMFNQGDRCGCGAGLSGFQLKVVHADTGELVTKFCRDDRSERISVWGTTRHNNLEGKAQDYYP